MKKLVYAALAAGLLATSACAAGPAKTPGTYVSQSEPVFLISEAQADQILVDAMNVEFGNSPIVRIEHPNRGYQATISFLFDSHQITATMVPSRGQSGDGASQGGYYFNVTHSGTMPLSGMSRSKRLKEQLSEAASALSPSVPAAS